MTFNKETYILLHAMYFYLMPINPLKYYIRIGPLSWKEKKKSSKRNIFLEVRVDQSTNHHSKCSIISSQYDGLVQDFYICKVQLCNLPAVSLNFVDESASLSCLHISNFRSKIGIPECLKYHFLTLWSGK